MKYILMVYDEEKFWIEIDYDGYALREIIQDNENIYHISCLEDCLAEGFIMEQDMEGYFNVITKDEFELVWSNVKNQYIDIWENKKLNTPFNTHILATYKYYYPQGYIFSIEDWLGIIKIDDKISIGMISSLKVGESIQGRIIGYDDINMWFVISFCSI